MIPGPCGPIVIRLQDSSLSNECAVKNPVKARRSDVQKSNASTSECFVNLLHMVVADRDIMFIKHHQLVDERAVHP